MHELGQYTVVGPSHSNMNNGYIIIIMLLQQLHDVCKIILRQVVSCVKICAHFHSYISLILSVSLKWGDT